MLLHDSWEHTMIQPLGKIAWHFLKITKKKKNACFYHMNQPVYSQAFICPRGVKAYILTETHVSVHAALFVAKNSSVRCPPSGE